MEEVVRSEKVRPSSEIRLGIEGLSMAVKARKSPNIHVVKLETVHHQDHDDDSAFNIPIKPFLSLCNVVLQVLDKIGPTMAVLRQDVHQNIQKLEKLYETDPLAYPNLVDMLKKEKNEGIARKGPSCSKAIVWLTRTLDFTATLLQKLVKDRDDQTMETAVEEAYNITLKPWHRWISSAAFRVALKLVPDKQSFMSLLLAKDESNDTTLEEEIQTFIELLVPFLEDLHSILMFYGLDRIKST